MHQLDMFEKELREAITNEAKERISWEVRQWGYISHKRLYRRELKNVLSYLNDMHQKFITDLL